METIRWSASRAAAILMLAAGTVLSATVPALAHEGREVGEYLMEVGFGIEPAFAGFENHVQLSVAHHDTEEPVTKGVAGSLFVEVGFGQEAMQMELEPAFGSPGEYRAYFIPTRSGQYTFRFTGAIGQQQIDEEFTSGPDTFSDVQDTSEVSFPVADPSTAEVAELLEQQNGRLTERIEALEAQLAEPPGSDAGLDARVAVLGDDVDASRGLAVTGIIAGILGLGVGAAALLLGRKRA